MSNENFVEPRDVAFVSNAALRVPERFRISTQDLATSVGGADLDGRDTMLECCPIDRVQSKAGLRDVLNYLESKYKDQWCRAALQ